MKPLHALALVVLLGAAGPQAAVSDLLLAPGVFMALPAGDPVAFRHSRQGGAGPLDDALTLAHPEGAGLVIAGAQPIAQFGVGSANPIALYFLESVVRAMADGAGGSPFYIRNRLREALARAPLTGAETVLTPFATDPNRDKMGGWGDLRLTIRADPKAPGGVRSLAATAAGYSETMVIGAGD